jgi:hypothetical protein
MLQPEVAKAEIFHTMALSRVLRGVPHGRLLPTQRQTTSKHVQELDTTRTEAILWDAIICCWGLYSSRHSCLQGQTTCKNAARAGK